MIIRLKKEWIGQGPSVIGLGNFDGLHRGHQLILEDVKALASSLGIASSVLLFSQHTREVLKDDPRPILTSLEDKISLLEEMGIEQIYIKELSQDFLDTSPRDFLEKLSLLQVRGIVCGEDYRFGRCAAGDLSLLQTFEKEGRVTLVFREKLRFDGQSISSTRIRELIKEGRVETAKSLLGRAYSIRGEIVHGEARGRTLGFPTANLNILAPYLLPKNGVYLTRATLAQGQYYGLTAVGENLTFHGVERKIETYLFDFSQEIYGEEMRLFFLHFLRPNLCFPSEKELIAQMQQDLKDGERLMDIYNI